MAKETTNESKAVVLTVQGRCTDSSKLLYRQFKAVVLTVQNHYTYLTTQIQPYSDAPERHSLEPLSPLHKAGNSLLTKLLKTFGSLFYRSHSLEMRF